MRSTKVEVFVFLILSIFGCGLQQAAPPEPTQMEQAIPEVVPEVTPEPSREVAPEVVEEYARINQISDLKKAEYYLTHPDYAKAHPHTPTGEDIAFYEREFLEKMYPKFKELAAKEGFMEARRIYMSNPPFGAGSRNLGSKKYAAIIQRLELGGGEAVAKLLFEEDPAAMHYREAMRLYKMERLNDAIKEMEIAVQIKPDAPAFLYNLGLMYKEKGNYARAVQLLQSSLGYIKATGYTKINLAMYSDVYMGACVNLGLIYTRVGMYNEAIKVLKEAIQLKPSDLDANRNLGNTYYTMGDMDKAAEQIRKYISLDPNDAEMHNTIGLIYYRKELRNAALDEFRIAVKLNPDEKQYSYNAGLVLAKLGRDDEANQAFQKSAGLKDGEEVRRVFSEQISANRVRELYNDGYAAMESLNLTRAIKLFKEVLELEPDMLEAHFNLGVCYRMRGNKENQIHHFEEAVRLKPDMPDAHYNLGLAYSDARMYPQAIAEFRQVVELKPSFKDARFNLGTVLYKTENYTAAAAEFEKSLESSPNWFEARLNLGSCYLKMGNVDVAIEQFEEAVQLKPNSAEAHYSLGEAYMRVEKFDKSSALFQKALQIDPGHRQARIRLKELETYQGN